MASVHAEDRPSRKQTASHFPERSLRAEPQGRREREAAGTGPRGVAGQAPLKYARASLHLENKLWLFLKN